MNGTRLARAARQALALLAILGAQMSQAQNVASGLGVTSQRKLPPADRVRQALNQVGAQVCADIVYRAAQFLFEDGDGDFTLQPLGPDSNRWPIVLTIESAHPKQGTSRLTILTLAPAGSCSGSYTQIITWPQSCAIVKSTLFASFRNERPLFRTVKQSELTPGIQLYLMPSGTGCVSVKKELIA